MNSPTGTRDPDQTRERILDAAYKLFVDKGFAAVSMRDLAEESGVTKSLIHHHFGSKEALWELVKERAIEAYAKGQVAELEAAEEPGPQLLHDSIERYFRFLQEHPEVARLFAWTHLDADQSCGKLDAELVRLGAERIRQAQGRGLLRADVNPANVVTLFVGCCTHWFQARAHHAHWPGVGDDEEFLDDFLKIVMGGLLPRDGKEGS
ncbi:TetR/AcrR family transcriptional regulator [Thioalkalivibrio sp. XN8]|uniref:TetR/AcrR family transcriptional regulator n=1 Tax=Thioalkalivibrio sp. XN8 TaxID=2712863 RepID=UPI0013EC1D09|nr:TetR/AcrR family transcriptional regulator [Thioalkalivibrio sp. XN8]NGP54180.1 TetR/AcrR family transcriptional regulator [Thioalkalivibrio sp. XN8]